MPKVIDVNQLFETTVILLAERGYKATTTQEVARRAGVNEATLFRRFGSKATLLEAALIHCFSNVPFAQVVQSGVLRDDLLSIVRAYKETSLAYGGVVLTLLQEIRAYPELRSVLPVLRRNLKASAEIIRSYQEREELDPGDPFQKVLFLLSPLILSGFWMRAGDASIPIDFDIEVVVDRFLHGHCGV